MFSRHDLQVVDVVTLTTSRKPSEMNHNMAYIDFVSVSDAIVGMAVIAGERFEQFNLHRIFIISS